MDKPEALRLAEFHECANDLYSIKTAAELRRLSAVEAQRDALLEALHLIAATDPVDAALDPQRTIRVARAAIKAVEGEKK